MSRLRGFSACLLALTLLTACGRAPAAGEALETLPVSISTAPTEAAVETVPETVGETIPETEPQPERFLLTFAGDCTFGATAANYYAGCGFIKTVGDDYGYPFRNVRDYFQGDDLTVVNLEGPLCDTPHPVVKRFVFRGTTDYVNILTQGSVEAVSLANNHTLDQTQIGYDSTRAALDAAAVPYVEADSGTLVTTASGLTVGLYGMWYYLLDVEAMTRGIQALREQGAEVVIVLPHWGTEYTYQPTSQQIEVGHAAIDAGADIVAGSHPHVLQPIEEYGGGLIFYSLGNFSFGGNAYPADLDTALLQVEVLRQPGGEIELGTLTRVPASSSSVENRNNFQPTPYAPGTEDYSRVMQKLDGSFRG